MTFPIFELVYKHLSTQRSLPGTRIGWHCHLTELTEIAAKTLIELGVELHLSECNASTTSLKAVERMQKAGAHVYLGTTSTKEVLAKKPLVISDTGFQLTSEYLSLQDNWLLGACEITTSGITRMRQAQLDLPVINLNDTQLKTSIENFHGVGDGLLEVLQKLDRSFTGQPVAIVGYGPVGAGCARYLKTTGAVVSIVEKDPIRALLSHYDGFHLQTLPEALKSAKLIVTASGQANLLSTQEWQQAADGILVVNVGHFRNELDIASLSKSATRIKISPVLEKFVIDEESTTYKTSTKNIYIVTDGHPANVVLLTGSDEPTLIHLTVEVLALAYLVELNQEGRQLPIGENRLPRRIEELASLLALKALNLSHNSAALVNENWQNRDRDLESSTQTC